jgi:hypothetical protein
MKDACEFYPTADDDPVCGAGSDISGTFVCTEEYGRTCQWANEERAKRAEARAPMNAVCEKCGRVYCDHENKY